MYIVSLVRTFVKHLFCKKQLEVLAWEKQLHNMECDRFTNNFWAISRQLILSSLLVTHHALLQCSHIITDTSVKHNSTNDTLDCCTFRLLRNNLQATYTKHLKHVTHWTVKINMKNLHVWNNFYKFRDRNM
jgi:succinate dehydrogenase hydrophobic anchor subunit